MTPYWLLVAFVTMSPSSAPPPPVPEVFAPGVVSGPADETSPAFTPDGNTVYFVRAGAILASRRTAGTWSAPELAPFSGEWADCEPALAPDGSYLIFASNRPATPGGTALDGAWGGQVQKGRGGNLWRVDRQGSGWGKPMRLSERVNRSNVIFSPSVVNDGSLYFMEATMTTKFRLYRSQFAKGEYQTAVPVPFSDGTWSDVDPVVAPDDSFMVFPSTRPPAKDKRHELFLVFRQGQTWGKPKHLGTPINDASAEHTEARLGADHRTLYFSSDRRVHLVFPRTLATAKQDLERTAAWDNGALNIWRVDLSSWLKPPALP